MERVLTERADARYERREEEIGGMGLDMRELERIILLRSIDSHWKDHIDAMDQLRQGISLRSFGQRDPVAEYKIEGFEMFDEMVRLIQTDTVRGLNFVSITKEPEKLERTRVANPVFASAGGEQPKKKQPVKAEKQVGRNDPCPCGSGKKYKYCCGK